MPTITRQAMNETESPVPVETPKKTPKRAAASGWVGSVLEYYDFIIYAQASALIFPLIFFPTGNAQVALVASMASYAVGFVARPIGAIVLGHWGDRHGRKNVLVLCMLLMGVSTVCVGLLPTYAQIGIWAPILLVVLRIVQGFAVAGELGGATAMIIEHAPFGRRGYYASFPLQGTQVATVIAAGAFLPLSALLPREDFVSWGWRIPFFLSAVVVVVAYVIRRRVDETPAFQVQEATGQPQQAPIVQVFRENWRNIIRAICIGMTNVCGSAVVLFGAAYATQPGYGIEMSTTMYLWIPIAGAAVGLVLIPLFGALSDRIGRRPLIVFGSLGSGLLIYPYLWSITAKQELLTIVLAVIIVGVTYQAWNAAYATFFQEMFPTRTRVTGFAVSQNVGLTLVAFLPMVFAVVAPPGATNVPLVIGGICLAITVISAIAVLSGRETNRIPLDDLGTPNARPVPRAEYELARTRSI